MAGIRRESYWNATAPASNHPTLAGDLDVDVAVVGGGIVGVIAARLLKDRGLAVALVEGKRVGEGVTGKSTAKITSQHNIAYTGIERKFDADCARHYADANEAGLRLIAELIGRHGIACDFARKPAFTYTLDDAEVARIEEEAKLAALLGLPASLTRETGLPYEVRAAMRWDDQAQFHPTKFVKGLAETLPGDGCHVFEMSRVTDWEPRRIATESGAVRARHVVMATHLPLGQIGLFYAENHPHMHPVIMGEAERAHVPDGMYISAETPHRSLRGHRDEHGRDWLIFTGPAFKVGDTEGEGAAFAELEEFAATRFGVAAAWCWTNMDYTPMDHAPFVGWSSSRDDAYLVATGFNAWGNTNGAAAAMLIADLVEGKENPWLDLYDATRIKPLAGGAEFVRANAEVAADLIGGYLRPKPRDFAELAAGEGQVMKIDGRNVAAWRDDAGVVHVVSAACTHMGCLVGWNGNDRTWDCPCHGSRFAADGAVLHGPAVKPLAPVAVEKETEPAA